MNAFLIVKIIFAIGIFVYSIISFTNSRKRYLESVKREKEDMNITRD